MSTPELLTLLTRPTGEWEPGPAPRDGPFYVRTSPAHNPVLHADNWLLKDIHGPNYEWAEIL